MHYPVLGSLIQFARACGMCWFAFQVIGRRNQEAEAERQKARGANPPG